MEGERFHDETADTIIKTTPSKGPQMADSNDPADRRRPARALAEQALHAEQIGDQEKADELMAEAERIDPDEVLAVLQERDAARGRQ